MSRKGFPIAAYFLLLATLGVAQTDSVSSATRIQYTGNLLFGALFGESGSDHALTAATTQGIRYKRWSAGLGIGYDDYDRWYTMPMFASVSFDFATIKRSRFFVNVQGGYAQAWGSDTEDWRAPETRGGKMYAAALGYRFVAAKNVSAYITSGYKFQRITYDHNYGYVWDALSEWVPPHMHVQRDMERVFVTMGFGFR